MGQGRTEVDAATSEFIRAQHMFFVATAPSMAGGDGGHINLSPKGLDTFRVLSPKRVGYLDFTGSGVETIAHIRDNGRLTIMLCAFEGRPNILRLYGRSQVVESADPEFPQLISLWGPGPWDGVRSIILMDVSRVSDSCGFGVPLYQYQGERDQMIQWAMKKGPDGIRAYQTEKNGSSLDGLPGLRCVARS